MWALIEDGSITKLINNPKAMVIGDIQYSRNIFSFRWSNEEREAIGLYEVVFNNSNKKDEKYYTNTNQSFAFAGGVVTASYGSATAKALADANATDAEGVDLDPVVVIPGLKTEHKKSINSHASSLLTPTDWYVVKATEVEGYSVPSAVTTYRAAVRTKSNEMETAINNAANVDALAALYVYNDENPPTRPLGEWPELEV